MKREELSKKINDIRKSKNHLTNAFLTMKQLDYFLEDPKTQILEEEGLILIAQDQVDLIRVYFYAYDKESIADAKSLLNSYDKPVIIDIVGRNPKAKEISEIFIANGFEKYSKFVRMICDKLPNINSLNNYTIEYAKVSDVEAIVELLYSEFDPLFSHIPLPQDIIPAIGKEEITVVRINEKIIGMAFFEETSPYNISLRYFIVDRDYRKQGIGSELLFNTFNKYKEDIKYMLWVGTHNSVMAQYKSLNFEQDGMVDYILRLKGE